MGRHFDELRLPSYEPLTDHIGQICFRWKDHYTKKIGIAFSYNIDFENWAEPFSLNQYAHMLRKVARENGAEAEFNDRDEDDFISNHFELTFVINESEGVTLEVLLSSYIDRAHEIETATRMKLMVEGQGAAVRRLFIFPDSIRSSCEQYLIYFAQFLHDLGIQARTEIKDTKVGTLFEVTPENEFAALERIREALDIYLRIPSAPAQIFLEGANDIAVLQLRTNVSHLHSQLQLAQAVIQAQGSTIKALEFAQYQRAFPVASNAGDSEQLLVPEVRVTQLKWNGIQIDLPAILRKLKRTLGGGS